jgi:hypothetical protein
MVETWPSIIPSLQKTDIHPRQGPVFEKRMIRTISFDHYLQAPFARFMRLKTTEMMALRHQVNADRISIKRQRKQPKISGASSSMVPDPPNRKALRDQKTEYLLI